MAWAPLRQATLIDVTDWDVDAEFGVFPQGARAKDAVFAPEAPLDPAITPGKRYLFKRSKRSYPDQFWGEIIAYRVGCLLEMDVPPAFVAWNAERELCAALIEWFYVDGEEVYFPGGDLLVRMQPDYDREKGSTHNLRQIVPLMRAMTQNHWMEENRWKQWWVDALCFDALIGNTDRHQDNWGLVLKPSGQDATTARLTPLFDNGTSLGHERFMHRVAGWQQSEFVRYVQKGTHHIAWSLEEPRLKRHIGLLSRALMEWPETEASLRQRMEAVSDDTLVAVLADLLHLPAPVALSQDRFDFILRLLSIRLAILKDLLS